LPRPPRSTRFPYTTLFRSIDTHVDLFKEMTRFSQVWMSHGDSIKSLPENFTTIASTPSVAVAAFKIQHEETYGIQFHPEVTHSRSEEHTSELQSRENLVCR